MGGRKRDKIPQIYPKMANFCSDWVVSGVARASRRADAPPQNTQHAKGSKDQSSQWHKFACLQLTNHNLTANGKIFV